MPAPWKSILVIVVLSAAVGPAADPPKPIHLPLTPFEVLALVHTEPSDDAVIRKLKESDTHFAPGAPELRQLRQLGVSDKVLVAVTTEQPPITQAPPAKPGRPVGTWVREVGPVRIILKFTEDRLTVTASDGEIVLTADADYSVNPEGLLFGVISGIDADNLVSAYELQELTGHTFSVRCRVDGTTLTVKELKAFGIGPAALSDTVGDFEGKFQLACGRYTRDDNAKPAIPKKAKPQQSMGGGPWNRDANPPPVLQTGCLSPVIAEPPADSKLYAGCARVVVVSSVECAPSEKPGPLPPKAGYIFTYCDVPEPCPYTSTDDVCRGVPTVTPPGRGDQGIRHAVAVASAPGDTLVGSWIRETDGVQVIAKFTEKRAFLTANLAFLDEKQEQRMTVRIEADYAIGPDGTVFGVITGTDLTLPKGDGSREMTSELRQLATMNGSPFCFRVRLDEGNLNVRDLRCGEFAGRDFAVRNSDAMMVLGRYKPLGNQEPAPPKPIKFKETCQDYSPPLVRMGVDFNRPETLPSPHYLKHYPQYFPPEPAFPLLKPEVAPAPRPVSRR